MSMLREAGDPDAWCHSHNVTYDHRVDDPGHFTFCPVPDRGFDAFLFAMIALLSAAVIHGRSGLSPLMVLAAGAGLQIISFYFGLGPLGNSVSLWLGIEPAELFLYAFLPPLLLDSAINIEYFKLKKFIIQVMTFAFLVVLGGTGLMVAVLNYLLGLGSDWNWAQMAVFTAIIASTDAVTVNAMLKSGGGPDELVVLMEGESLFNDASSMVMFTIFYKITQQSDVGPAMDAIPMVANEVVKLATGGALLGYVMGYIARKLIAWMQSRACIPAQEITIIFACVYLSMYIGQAVLNVSGVIAVVVFSLYGASKGEWYITTKAHEQLHGFVNTLSFGVQGLIFFYAGASSINFLWRAFDVLLHHGVWLSIVQLFAIYIAMFVVRYICILFFNQFFALMGMALPWNVVAFATVGALRGALSLIMVQVVIQDKARDNERKGRQEEQIDIVTAQMVLWTAGFVLCTLLINAPLMPWFMRITGLITEAPASRMMRAKAKRALLRFTETAIEDLQNDEDEMLRGVDWQHVIEYTDLEDDLKRFGELQCPASSAQDTAEQEGVGSRLLRILSSGVTKNHHAAHPQSMSADTSALEEQLMAAEGHPISPITPLTPAADAPPTPKISAFAKVAYAESKSSVPSRKSRASLGDDIETGTSPRFHRVKSMKDTSEKAFGDEDPLQVARLKKGQVVSAPMELVFSTEDAEANHEAADGQVSDVLIEDKAELSPVRNHSAALHNALQNVNSGLSLSRDLSGSSVSNGDVFGVSGTGVLVPALGQEKENKSSVAALPEWVPTPSSATATAENSSQRGALAYLQRSSYQSRSKGSSAPGSRVLASVSTARLDRVANSLGTMRSVIGGGQGFDDQELLAESRMRLISGFKRFMHMKKTEGLLSSRGLQILDYSCDIAIDHPRVPLTLWHHVEREVVGRMWVRMLARVNFHVRKLARLMEGCCGWFGLHYLIIMFSGYLSHQLSGKMLLACEVAVAYFLALSYTPFSQILLDSDGSKDASKLQEEIAAEAQRVWKFIIDREIEAPERFQAIQSYRAAMAILHKQVQFVDELYVAGMVDETEREMLMEVIAARIRSLERSGASWRSPTPMEFMRSIPFLAGVSQHLFMEFCEAGEIISYDSGQVVINPISARLGDHGVYIVIHGLLKGYAIFGSKCREFYMGSGTVFGLMTSLTGEPLPGGAGVVAEGNALGKGPVLFHLPRDSIQHIAARARQGDAECQQLELDMYRMASLNIAERCKGEISAAATVHYSRMLTQQAMEKQCREEGAAALRDGVRTGNYKSARFHHRLSGDNALDVLQEYGSDEASDSEEDAEDLLLPSQHASSLNPRLKARHVRQIQTTARRYATELLQFVRDSISEASLVELPCGGVLKLVSHTVLARGQVRVRAKMNTAIHTGKSQELPSLDDSEQFDLVVEFTGPYLLPWLYDQRIGIMEGTTATPQPIALEATKDCVLLVSQPVPSTTRAEAAAQQQKTRNKGKKAAAVAAEERCARLVHHYTKTPDKLCGVNSVHTTNQELFDPSDRLPGQQAARVVQCTKVEATS